MSEKTIFHRIGLSMTIFMVIWIGLQIALALILEEVAPGAMARMEWLYWLVSSGPMYLVAFPVILKLLKPLPKRNIYQHDLHAKEFVMVFFMSIALMFIGNIIGIILTTVLGNLTGVDFAVSITETIVDFKLIWILLISVIVAPLVEEIIFRKVLIDRMIMFGDGVAIFVSALMFALLHGNLNQLFYAFGLGLILGFIYVRTGKVRNTIILHMLFNFVGGFVPAAFMKVIDFASLQDGLSAGNGIIILERIGALLGLVGFEILLVAFGIAGFVLLIVHRKKFILYKGEIEMGKAEVAKSMLKTPGIWLWIAATVALFVINIVGIG